MNAEKNTEQIVKVTADVQMEGEDSKMLPHSPDKEKLENNSLKRVFLKNIIAANVAMFFFLTGFIPLISLQSSMNSHLGTTASAIFFVFMIVACFLSSAAMDRLGTKNVFLLGFVASIVFTVANFYPTPMSLFPAAIVTGVGSGFCQLAFRTYTAKLGHQYTTLFKTGADRIQSRISVLAFIQQRGGGLVGSAISSLILGIQTSGGDETSHRLPICGANYCNENFKKFQLLSLNDTNYENGTSSSYETEGAVQYADGTSSRHQVYSFLAFCVAVAIVAVILLLVTVKSLPKLGLSDKSQNPMSVFQLLTGTLQQHTDVRLLMIVPLMMTPYANDSFWHADFYKAYVTCSIGMHNIGYVSVWSSVASIASSIIFGWFNTKKYRSMSLGLATVVQVGTVIALLYHKPSTSSYVMLSVYSACYYIGSGIRQSLIPALISVVFKDNLTIALSNLLLWGSIGGAIVFGLSNYLCIRTKIYLLLGLLIISYVLYIIFEIRLKISSAKKQPKN